MTRTDTSRTGTKAVVAEAFHNAADDYETVGPAFFDLFGRELVRRADIRPGMRVLDVGCGAGSAMVHAAQAVGPEGHVLGIDIAPGMVDRAAREAAARGWSHVEIRLGDAEDPPVPDADRDRIIAAQVLFFLPAPEQAVARFRQILTPGGVLAISTWGPDDPAWTPVYRALFGQIPAGSAPTLTPSGATFSSAERITTLLTDAGFIDVRHEMVTYDVVYSSADEWLRWSRTHGARAFWDAIPADRRDAAGEAAMTALETIAKADGTLHMSTPVRYTTAVEPQ